MEIAHRISVAPDVVHGAPVITGTRVLVSIVKGSLAGGMSREEVRPRIRTLEVRRRSRASLSSGVENFSSHQRGKNQ